MPAPLPTWPAVLLVAVASSCSSLPVSAGATLLTDQPLAGETRAGGFQETGETATTAKKRREIRFQFEDSTLDKLKVEGDFDFTLRDIDREFTRLQFRGGDDRGGPYIGVIMEDFLDGDADLFGIEFGADGYAPVGSYAHVSPAVDYAVGISPRVGDSNAFGDMYLLEGSGRVGAGVRVSGVQMCGGLAAQALYAFVSSNGPLGDASIYGANVAPYLRAYYRSAAFPLTGGLQLMFGDIDGLLFGLGFQF